jgi:ADP-heptose:LPS heptosyltransferase
MTRHPAFLVRRLGALGDVILTTPVIRRLNREDPDIPIVVETLYGDVFRNSPRGVYAVPPGCSGLVGEIVDLNLAYEIHPKQHIVQSYMERAFHYAGPETDWLPELFPVSKPKLPKRAIAVHAAVAGWASRTLPRETWRQVVVLLRKCGYAPILVGTDLDALPGVEATAFHSTDLLAQAALIGACAAFVGSDSALMHVAAAMRTPHVGVFTCTDPALRLPRVGVSCRGVVAAIDCAGCLHTRPPPVTTEACARGDLACVSAVTAEEIVEAVLGLLAELK